MLVTIIKSIFIYFFCVFICEKSLSKPQTSLFTKIVLSFILATSSSLLSIFPMVISHIITLSLLWTIVSIHNSRPQITLIALTASFIFSYVIYGLLSFIVALITFSFHNLPVYSEFVALLSGLLHSIVICKLFSLKRFKKGIPFFSSSTQINIVTFLCLAFLASITYFSLQKATSNFLKIGLLLLLILIFTLTFLIYWWQAQIKKTYLRKLEIQELESTRTQLAELKLLNQQLVEENTRLSRISHRDNTLITALKNTATHLLSTLDPESAEAITAGELLRNLETLSAERATMANESEPEETIPFDTGYSLLDSVLNEMNVQAHRNAIAFSVHFGTGLDAFVPNGIAEIDLMHIVDDLLKNAFKSTLTKETRAVQLQFYKSDKHLVVEVADSGIPFEVESLINMGLERRTTYSDGSGIGLVEIWEAKEKYRATYHLEEYQNADPFTKRISIAFDKKNRYSIRTHRKAEILKQARRADLQVYSDTE